MLHHRCEGMSSMRRSRTTLINVAAPVWVARPNGRMKPYVQAGAKWCPRDARNVCVQASVGPGVHYHHEQRRFGASGRGDDHADD